MCWGYKGQFPTNCYECLHVTWGLDPPLNGKDVLEIVDCRPESTWTTSLTETQKELLRWSYHKNVDVPQSIVILFVCLFVYLFVFYIYFWVWFGFVAKKLGLVWSLDLMVRTQHMDHGH